MSLPSLAGLALAKLTLSDGMDQALLPSPSRTPMKASGACMATIPRAAAGTNMFPLGRLNAFFCHTVAPVAESRAKTPRSVS